MKIAAPFSKEKRLTRNWFRPLLIAAALAAAPLFGETAVQSNGGGLEKWLPEDVIGFVKVNEAVPRIQELLRSDLRKKVEASKIYNFVKSQENYKKFEAQLKEANEAVGRDVLEVADDVLGKEVIAGLRLGFFPEVLVITRSRSAAALKSGLESVKELFRKKHGGFPETQKSERHGATIESIDGKVFYAVLEDTFLASNTQRGIEDMIDLARGKSTKSARSATAFAPVFQGVESGAKGGPLAVAAVRPRFIPNFRVPPKTDNPLVSLIATGWLEAVRGSELISAKLTAVDGKISLQLSNQSESSEGLAKVSSIFFPATGAAAEMDELSRFTQDGLLGFIHLRRGFSEWWEKREEFLVPSAVGELTNFSNVMNVVFAGHSFQDEVLPELEPGFTLVSSRVRYEGLETPPVPQIPAFAGIFRLKSADKFSRSMTSAYQSLVAIINLDRAQKQKGAGLLLNQVKVGDVDVYSSVFDQPKEKKGALGIEYNFSPSFAVVGTKVIISSNLELAKKLVESFNAKPSTAVKGDAAPAGIDSVRIDGAEVEKILFANRQILIDKTMLDEGVARGDAEGRIDALLEVVRYFKDLRLDTVQKDRLSTIHLDLRLTGAGGEGKEGGSKKDRL